MKTLILGPKTQILTFTLSERTGLEILEKVEKSWKMTEKSLFGNPRDLLTISWFSKFF